MQCSDRACSAADRDDARQLLAWWAAELVRLVCNYLGLQRQREAARLGSRAAGMEEAVADGLVRLVDIVLCSILVALSDAATAGMLQPAAVRELEHALLAASRESAACCGWLPDTAKAQVRRVNSLALNGLARLFASLHGPLSPQPLPHPRALPQPPPLRPPGIEPAGPAYEAGSSGAAPRHVRASGVQTASTNSGRPLGGSPALPAPTFAADNSMVSYADVTAGRSMAAAFGGGQAPTEGRPAQPPKSFVQKTVSFIKNLLQH